MSLAFVRIPPIKYTTFRWEPPCLTSDQQREMGRQIHLRGKDHFLKQFLAPPDQSISADPKAERGPGEKPSFVFRPFSKDRPPGVPTKPVIPVKSQGEWDAETVVKGVAATAVAAGAVAATVALAPQVALLGLGAGAYVGVKHFGSKRLAVWRYGRWLDACLKKYLENRATHEVVPCGQCRQKLRIPNNKGRLTISPVQVAAPASLIKL